MKCHRLNNQHGSVLLFTTVTLVLLLVFGGIAIDLTYFGSVRRELQRSMDAAALAGAGNLGFDDTAFPAARAAAQNYANLNGYSDPAAGVVSLNPNTANDPDGEIVLGIWDGANFVSSLDGTRVNAVRCSKFETPIPIPTSFLRLLGMANLPMRAQAIAVANPPETIPDTSCVGPFAVSCCAFGCNSSTSAGCGKPITFHTSSGKEENDCVSPPCTNTGAWANVCELKNPTPNSINAAIDAAARGDECQACNTDGQPIQVNNGVIQPAIDHLAEVFLTKYYDGQTHTVTDSSGKVAYSGPGWKLIVPVIDTVCPPKDLNGVNNVVGWTVFVMTAVVTQGKCYPSNPADLNLPVSCPTPEKTSIRAVFGYYSCDYFDGVASRDPGPRSSLGTKLRLVK